MPTLSMTLPRCHLRLPAGQALSLQQAADWQIHCEQGQLWLTETGQSGDVILLPGQVYQPAGRGRIVLEALSQPNGVAGASLSLCKRAGRIPRIFSFLGALRHLIHHADARFPGQNAGLHLTARHAGL